MNSIYMIDLPLSAPLAYKTKLCDIINGICYLFVFLQRNGSGTLIINHFNTILLVCHALINMYECMS